WSRASSSRSRIWPRLPSRSPTRELICASASLTRFSPHSLKQDDGVVLTIDPRYRGPDTSGNGGYTCGLVAAHVAGDAEVTLRLPPPLGRPLRVEPRDDG